MKNKYALFYAAFNTSTKKGNSNTKEEMVQQFTNGRTNSLKDLDEVELQELIKQLQFIAYGSAAKESKANKMRKAIIAIFYSMGKTVSEAKQWSEKQGAKGIKKSFNDYTTGELFVLISIAEKIKSDWQKSIRKQLTQKFEEQA